MALNDSQRRVAAEIRAEAQRWSDRAAAHEARGDHARAAAARRGAEVHGATADRLSGTRCSGVCEHDVSIRISPPDEHGWQVVTCGACERVLELLDSRVS